MRGIVLAGGVGTRLFPLTKQTNKHVLPVGRYPMIYHPLHTLKEGGINDIMIISGKEHMGSLISHLGSGSGFGMRFTYRIQDNADGIAGALKLCEDFIRTYNSTHFVAILGDNIFEEKIEFGGFDFSEDFVYSSRKQDVPKIPACKLFLKKVRDPNRFGVVKLQDQYGNRVVKIIEKPKTFVSNLAVTGCYVYDYNIWGVLDSIKLSERNEFEITDVNNWYVENGVVLYKYLNGAWTDAGTHESLLKANQQCKALLFKDFEEDNV
jgi:glucose-1-phosphate thymidylyltransferase